MNRTSIWIAMNWLLAAVVFTFVAGFVVIVVQLGREGWRTLSRMQAYNNFKSICLGLQQYHDRYNHFPPVVQRNADGVAMHSWRTRLLPNLSSADFKDYGFVQYDFNKRWDDPANRTVAERFPLNSYPFQILAIVGPGAAWDEHGTRKYSDFKDGLRETAMVIAVRDTGIPWYEPRDARFDGETLWLGDPADQRPVPISEDVFLLMADGSVQFFAHGLTKETLRAIVTIDADDDPGCEW